jgi:hypothetical protein
MSLTVVPLSRAGEYDKEVRSLFAATVMMGLPTGHDIGCFGRYEHLCLDWYLSAGRRHAAVVIDEVDDSVVGYALMCTDERSFNRWTSRAIVWTAVVVMWRLVTGRLDRRSIAFWWQRTRDAVELRRGHAQPPARAHAHMNVRVGNRSGGASLRLLKFLDECATGAGETCWYGEINTFDESRVRALQRLGLDVVHRSPNMTLSRYFARPVERLTVVRRLAVEHARGRQFVGVEEGNEFLA